MKISRIEIEEYLQSIIKEEQNFAQQLLSECTTIISYKIIEQRVEPNLSIFILQEWEYDDGSLHQNSIIHDYEYINTQIKTNNYEKIN